MMNRAEKDVDLEVLNTFFGDGLSDRTIVDVGAARPDYLSVSSGFRDRGWRVIAVEPNPEFAALHRTLGHEVYEYACGMEDTDDVDFCIINSHGQDYEGGSVSYESFSSLSLKPGYESLLPESASRSTVKVKMRRLDSILAEAGVRSVDVLSVDVEGWELEVLKGIDLKAFTPSVVILENFLNEAAYKTWMRRNRYRLWKELYPNQVYIRSHLMRRLPIRERLSVWADNL